MPSPFTHRIIPLDKGWVQFAEGSWNLMVHQNTSSTEGIILLMRNALENITHHGGLNETSFNTSYWNASSSLDLTDERCQDIKDLPQWSEVPPLLGELKCEKRWTSLENFLGLATTDDLQQIQNHLDQNLEQAHQISLHESNQLKADLAIIHNIAADHRHLEKPSPE
jgi:hypothetical protein